jgi:protein-S-isoprenylcysteine O-methyltransferase Ste14
MINLVVGLNLVNVISQTGLYLYVNSNPNTLPDEAKGEKVVREPIFKYINPLQNLGYYQVIALPAILTYFGWNNPEALVSFPQFKQLTIASLVSLVGGVLRVLCFRELGMMFTFKLGIKSGAKLIRTGPYKYVRHASYTGILLSFVGFQWMCSLWLQHFVSLRLLPSWISLYSWCFTLGYLVLSPLLIRNRVRKEEQLLKEHFGKEYDEYEKSTTRFIPYLF